MTKNITIIISLLFFLVVAILISLSIGDIPMSLSDISNFFKGNTDFIYYDVLALIRIPRTVLALAIGGGLSLSGVILQGIYRNPLVEPYTLGISGGASLAITIVLVSGINIVGRFMLPIGGFIGAFTSIFLVYFLSLKRGAISINRMLLIGVMVSFISSSLILFLMSVTTHEKIPSIVFWTMGSLNESDPLIVSSMLILSFLILFISYFFAIPLNALRIGESKAKHLGINTPVVIKLLFIITSLLTGCCIAVAGVIGFVGLIIPHISRLFIGTDHRFLLIVSFLSGSIFLILCDVLARTIILPNELPIGVITGILGGVSFLLIISQSKMKSKLQ